MCFIGVVWVGPNPQYLLSMPVFRKDLKEGVTQISKTLNGSKRKKCYFRFLGLLWQSTTTRGLEMMQIYSLLAVETKWELSFTRLKSGDWQGWFLMEALGKNPFPCFFQFLDTPCSPGSFQTYPFNFLPLRHFSRLRTLVITFGAH